VVGEGSVVRHNSVVEGCRVPDGFYIPSTCNIHSDEDLARIEPVTPDVTGFSESVAQANHELVKGYKRIRNEF
jgi:carbonic anhydrase/acetyltransferase-like protein (isoleucine patch superfamily)